MKKMIASTVLASFMVFSLVPSLPADSSDKYKTYIHLKNGSVPIGSESNLIHKLTELFNLQKAGQKELYLVQLNGPVQDEWKHNLRLKGAVLGDYIPDFAFITQMDTDAVKAVSQLDFVSSVSPFKTEYKIDRNLKSLKTGNALVRISVFGGDSQKIRDLINNLNGTVKTTPGQALLASVSTDIIDELAQDSNIIYMESVPEFKFFNDKAGSIVGAPLVWNNSLQGQGQVIGVADTGIDTGQNDSTMHKDLQGRIKAIYTSATSTGKDTNGHGTHVSGSIVGNGTLSNGQVKGIAPQAQLVFQAVSSPTGGVYLPADLGTLFTQAYTAGARIHSDSWGTGKNSYDSSAQSVDRFMWNNNDMTILFAAGNDGDRNNDSLTDYSTISSPATAKNVITVGASENNRPTSGTLSDEPNKVAFFSSRGNTSDGRLKPDVVSPGSNVLSTKSSLIQGTGPYNNAYQYMSGTSMATPITAGAAALIRQYYIERTGITPKPSLLKATLINGAQDMGYGYPSRDQGWGRTNLGSLFPGGTNTFKFDNESTPLSTGGSKQYTYNVTSSTVPLKISAVWTDYPGSSAASKALVNDLDLMVTGPDGTIYNGNDFLSPFNDTADRLNNVENVIIKAPKTGTYRITVKGYNVPSGPQKYSLVVSGAVADGTEPAPSQPSVVQTAEITQTGYLSSASSPTYKLYYIDVTAPGQIKLNLKWSNSTDLDLYLLDPAGVQLAKSAGKLNPEVITFNATSTGRYCIKVNAYSGGATYALTINTPYSPAKTGILTAKSSVDTNGASEVFYEIPVGAAGTVNTQVSFNNSNQTDIDLYLYGPDGTIAARASSGWYRNPETFSFPVDRPGVYRLKVKAFRGTTDFTMQTLYPK